MFKWFLRLATVVGSLALLLYLGWLGWSRFGPRPPELSALRRQLADQILPSIVEDLRKGKDDIRSVVVLHLANDPTHYLTDQLRRQLQTGGVLDVFDPTLDEKTARALNLRVPGTVDRSRAVSEARGRGAQAVLFGEVRSFESYPSGATIDLEVNLVHLASRDVVFQRPYKKEITVGLLDDAAVQDELRRHSPGQRFLGWLLCVLLLPVFTIGFIRAMVRRSSNRANAFTLGVYTCVNATLAYLLLGANLASLTSVLLFLLLVGGSVAYTLGVMTFALRLET